MSCVFVSSPQASKQAAGGKPGRKSGTVGRHRYEASKSEGEKGRKANLSTLQTTSSAAWINTFTYRHSQGRHVYRQLSVTSVTSLYLSFFFPIFKASKIERIPQGGRKGVEEEGDSATTMSFAEAEQTGGAESLASDISWTYSLDLVDSLKLPRSFPLWDLKDMFFHTGWKRKQWPKKKLGKKMACRGYNEENAEGLFRVMLIIQWIYPQLMLHF